MLTVMFNPGIRILPDLNVDPEFFHSRPVFVAGLPGFLSTPKDGLGAQRLDWVDAAGYHGVHCDRLQHVEGIAGCEPEELVRVASSLYA